MKYQQASLTHLIHPKTFKLVPKRSVKDATGISVPFFLWKRSDIDGTEEIDEGRSFCFSQMSPRLDLNDFFVEWRTGTEFRFVQCDFKNEITGHRVFFRLESYTNSSVSYSPEGSREAFYGVDYRIEYTQGFKTPYRQEYPDTELYTQHYFPVPDLTSRQQTRIGKNQFAAGISDNQWKVSYRGKLLDGKTYALLSCTYAFLLTDDLKFDTLVYLEGLKNGVLYVNKFVYTVNPYITKIMMLSK